MSEGVPMPELMMLKSVATAHMFQLVPRLKRLTTLKLMYHLQVSIWKVYKKSAANGIPHILLIEQSKPIGIYQTKMCSVHWFYWPTTSLTMIQLLWQWHQSRISGEKETTLQHMGAGRTRLLHFALQLAAESVIKGPEKGANVRKRGRGDAACSRGQFCAHNIDPARPFSDFISMVDLFFAAYFVLCFK